MVDLLQLCFAISDFTLIRFKPLPWQQQHNAVSAELYCTQANACIHFCFKNEHVFLQIIISFSYKVAPYKSLC